ncbi:MAG: sulfatase-like hydrolase/transferase [Planctomycetes bacterium]|nr:sulfatase-like hydrolase/transferase [Planctomycetota bacterium]
MKFKTIAISIVLVLAAVAIYFQANKGPKIRNVLLISMDTTRADYLSCYGYPRETTPFIDSLAAEGVLFENAISPAPLTLPSHSSMLTGTIPPYHGVHDNLEYRLGESNITLAEVFKDNGYQTAAVVSSYVLDSQFGLDQGFDYYNDQFVEKIIGSSHFAERRGQETTEMINNWLGENGQEPFFMFAHYYDPHAKYDAPEPFGSKFSSQFDIGIDIIKNNYAEEIAYTDHCINQVVDKLKEIGQYDSTLIIITGDHGEMLGEHGEMTHAYFVYRGAIHVPLIFKVPGMRDAKRIQSVAGLIDIVPTVCSLLEIEIDTPLHGKDVSDVFYEKAYPEDRYVYSESLVPTTFFNANSLLSVTTNDWQYIQTTRPELYSFRKDLKQQNNLIHEQSNRSRVMQDKLKNILEAQVRTDISDGKNIFDEDTKKKLESLGYVQGGNKIDESFSFDQSRPDPKDIVGFYIKKLDVVNYMMEKEYDRAREICHEIRDGFPDNSFPLFLLGDIAKNEKKYQEAIDSYRKGQEIDPDNYKGYSKLGVVFSLQEKYSLAIGQFQKALQLRPDDMESLREIGVAYAHLEDYAESTKYLSKAIEIFPEDAVANAMFAESVYRQQKIDEAIEYWERALELDPEVENVKEQLAEAKGIKQKVDAAAEQNKIAESYFAKGDIAMAIEHWKKAVAINDKWPAVLNNLAWILSTSKDENIRDPQSAMKYGLKACELTGYKNAELLDSLAVAYAASGNFSEGIKVAEKAINIAILLGMEAKAKEIGTRLELYMAGRPYYENY